MRTVVAIVLTMALVGCTTPVPVKQKFPEAPTALMIPCPGLESAQRGEKALSELMKTVVKNYGHYKECAMLVEEWQTWYRDQKKNSGRRRQVNIIPFMSTTNAANKTVKYKSSIVGNGATVALLAPGYHNIGMYN